MFLKDNSKTIDTFFKVLGIKFNKSKIKNDFLMTQDLSLGASQILNIEKFICFCIDYDRPYPDVYKLSRKTERG